MRSLVSVLFLLTLAVAPALASEGVPMAVVKGPARIPGVYVATINPGVTIQKRDILAVQRQGKIIGEVMAAGTKGDLVGVVPEHPEADAVQSVDVLLLLREGRFFWISENTRDASSTAAERATP